MKILTTKEYQEWVVEMLTMEKDDFDIPLFPRPLYQPKSSVQEHVSRKKSYAAFKVYLVFVALGYAYWMLS